jgi:hypothetical protein
VTSLSAAPAASAPAHKTAHATKKHRRDVDELDIVAVVPASTKK